MYLAVVLIEFLCRVFAQTQTTDSMRFVSANTAINSDMDCQSVFTYASVTTLEDYTSRVCKERMQ